MVKNLSKIDKNFLIALLIGLVIRLVAIPFTMSSGGDSVTRIFIAQKWMADPHLITYGVWGPLHTYLIAGILYIWNDVVYAPAFLHCLISAFVAVPLYLFVKREWNESAALFTACLYLIYPVGIHYSFDAMAEIPFIFLILLTMLILSYARDENGNWKYALAAGIVLTLASSLRYESWGLTPFFSLLLWKRWKSMIAFLISATIFPLFWIIGNYFGTGDPFYNFTWAMNWELEIGLNNQDVSAMDYIIRVISFPRSLLFGITPLAFLVCAIGIIQVIYYRNKKWVWLIPLVALFITYTANAISGAFSALVRYSIILAIFIIPFAAEWYIRQKENRRFLYSVIVLGSMLPFSFLRFAIPWPFDFPHPVPKEVVPLPRLEQSSVRISEYQNQISKEHPGGLFLDFYAWDETYYIALMSRKNVSNIFIMPGDLNEPIEMDRLEEFLINNPYGVLLLTESHRYLEITQAASGEELIISGYPAPLAIEFIEEVEHVKFYKYTLLNP